MYIANFSAKKIIAMYLTKFLIFSVAKFYLKGSFKEYLEIFEYNNRFLI